VTTVAEHELVVVEAARLVLDALRRTALELVVDGAPDPVIQRHIANVCNAALDLIEPES